MKKFIALSFLLIGFAFLTVPLSASKIPPPQLLTVSAGQLQLDPIVIKYVNAEQTVSVITLQPFYAYRAIAVMPEIAELSNLPKPPVLYSNLAAAGSTTLIPFYDRSCIRYLTCIDVSKKALPFGNYRISMRQVARNAVISENAPAKQDRYNLNALIRI